VVGRNDECESNTRGDPQASIRTTNPALNNGCPIGFSFPLSVGLEKYSTVGRHSLAANTEMDLKHNITFAIFLQFCIVNLPPTYPYLCHGSADLPQVAGTLLPFSSCAICLMVQSSHLHKSQSAHRKLLLAPSV